MLFKIIKYELRNKFLQPQISTGLNYLLLLVRLAPGGHRALALGFLDLLRELLHLGDGRVQLVLQLLVGSRGVEAVLRGGRPQAGLHGGADWQPASGSLKAFVGERWFWYARTCTWGHGMNVTTRGKGAMRTISRSKS